MFLDGFSFNEFRSFGAEQTDIGPLRKINFFIGQNNSGKSNILMFVKRFLSSAIQALRSSQVLVLEQGQLDWHLQMEGVSTVGVALQIGGQTYQTILERAHAALTRDQAEWPERILKSQALTKGTGMAWFYYRAGQSAATLKTLIDQVAAEHVLGHNEWAEFFTKATKKQGGDIKGNWIPEVLHFLSPVQLQMPTVELIPAVRKIGAPESSATDYSGEGIIQRLAELQHPSFQQYHLQSDFDRINEFLRVVTGRKDSKIEIPNKRDMILVHMEQKMLPLASLGTGIHEVIMLAAAATLCRSQIVCIEEPELHLHPLLQKQLCRYLSKETNNQYLITTHSSHILDAEDASIFFVQNNEGKSIVNHVQTDCERSVICGDLGYRASDLLQANSIIWVEGPSDRLYIRHWINSIAPNLIEGLHYCIMFYGGRLLSHLSANDPEVNSFISLRRLNRHIALVMDSDKHDAQYPLNDTKARIKEEFEKGDGFAWVTEGREIENYVDPAILEGAVKLVYKDAVRLRSVGQYDQCLAFIRTDGTCEQRPDKVKISHEVSNSSANLDVLNLRTMVAGLVEFVRRCNDFPEI